MRNAECATREGERLILKGLKAHGRVVGRMFDMRLEQTYFNPEKKNVEVIYTFPLPHDAVLLGIEVTLNGETLRGKVSAKAAAREKYEDGLADGHTALLLTVQPNGTHTLELGNVMAGETAVITLNYAQVLKPEQGSLRLMLPTTLAPRYGDPVRQGRYEPHAVPQTSATVEYPFELVMRVEGELALARIGSPSHTIQLQLLPTTGAVPASAQVPIQEIRLARSACLDRDFVLQFDQLLHPSQALAAWDQCEDGVGVVMASFTPIWEIWDTGRPTSVVLKLLVDCSGSMGGDSIEAARSALHQVIEGLQSHDRFSLSRFGSHVEHRSKTLWKLSSRTQATAHRWITQLDADLGGTEMAGALESTLRLSGSTRADVLMVTDGEVEAVDEVIGVAKSSGQRIFVVGIGSSPAELLLRRLAEETGGSCEFVAPGEEVESAILRLYHRMRCPSVTAVGIRCPQGLELVSQTDVPKALFDGDSFTVYARCKSADPEILTQPWVLSGRLDGDAADRVLAEASPMFVTDEANTLARLAAHTRYTQLRRSASSGTATLSSLPSLAEQYQLVTDDTSFVLVKERASEEQATDMPELRQVKHMLAAGWGALGSVKAQDNMSVPALYMRRASVGAQMQSVASFPGLFRSPRRASSSLVDSPLDMSDMGDFEIPAFLRKQPDDEVVDGRGMDSGRPRDVVARLPRRNKANWANPMGQDTSGVVAYKGWTPAGYAEWLQVRPDKWPQTYAGLRKMGLGELVVQWLELCLGENLPESEVVQAFNAVMSEIGSSSGISIGERLGSAWGLGEQPRMAAALTPDLRKLADHIRVQLNDMTPQNWPDNVLLLTEDADVR